VIENPLAWAKKLLGWTRGEKHPNTPYTVFANCYQYDRVRTILPARCRICDYVVSRDEKAVRELIYVCDNKACHCHQVGGSHAHQVCSVCYDLFHSLYMNYQLKDMNYFRNLDEKDKRDGDDWKRRDRMGL